MKSIDSGFRGILVNGIHEYDINPVYHLKMIVSLANIDYDSLPRSFETIKNDYLGKLVDEGLIGSGKGTLVEDDLAYAMMGYDKEGTVVQYKTTSLEMVQQFLSVKSEGVIKSESTFTISLSEENVSDYSQKALINAKEKAKHIAKNLNKTLGDPVFIEDLQPKKYIEGLYYSDMLETRLYQITVGFELV